MRNRILKHVEYKTDDSLWIAQLGCNSGHVVVTDADELMKFIDLSNVDNIFSVEVRWHLEDNVHAFNFKIPRHVCFNHYVYIDELFALNVYDFIDLLLNKYSKSDILKILSNGYHFVKNDMIRVFDMYLSSKIENLKLDTLIKDGETTVDFCF
jgi:hypothetical protein